MRQPFGRRLKVRANVSISRFDLPNIIFGPALAFLIGRILVQQEGANLLWLIPVLIVIVTVAVLLWRSLVSKGLAGQVCWFIGALSGFAAVALINAACHAAKWNLPIVFGLGHCFAFVTIMVFWRLNIELVLRL
ncbi:MAG: hypothetical protein JW759_08415 [Candidatus Coatesbacteria bacterium]|nr:hypothetical protein [Candidatus Coatesbacteria bacterium]